MRDPPYSLLKGDLIRVRAKASNLKGFNDSYSDSGTSDFTLVVENEPTAPLIPTQGADTRYNVLHVMWTQIADYSVASGGVKSAILSYELQRNEGNNTDGVDLWQTLNGFDSDSLVLEF